MLVGVTRRVGADERVDVVVFVDVLDEVVESVGTAKFTSSLLSVEQFTKLS